MCLLQVAGLTGLQCLELDHPDYPASGFAALTSFARLERLQLNRRFRHLPACLPRLTGLRHLCLLNVEQPLADGDAELLARALPQLTHLELEALELQGVLGALSALSRLAHLSCYYSEWGEPGGLPAGAWLPAARLERLALPAHTAAASLAALAPCSRLRALGLYFARYDLDYDGSAASAAADVCSWAAQRPSLRQLSLTADFGADDMETAWAALLWAQRLRPDLHINVLADGDSLWRAMFPRDD